MQGYNGLNVDSFLKLSLADHHGSKELSGALPGEIFLTGAAQQTVRSLAGALTTDPDAPASNPIAAPPPLHAVQ